MYTFGSWCFTPAAPHFLFVLTPSLIPIKNFQGQASWLYLTSSHACHVIFFPSYPLSIIGAKKFYTVLVDILSMLLPPSYTFTLIGFFQLGVIGYWCTPFAAIVLTEHFVFRESSFSAYNTAHWDQAKLLLPGIAAILTFLGAFGVSISSMSQTWYTGPIARAGSGDIGMYTGGVVAVSLYILLRTLERKMWPGR